MVLVQYKGSLGSILTRIDNTKLVSYYGQPVGRNPLSFCLEIYTFLAVVLVWLLFLLAGHYDEVLTNFITITSKICLYTDSKSILD